MSGKQKKLADLAQVVLYLLENYGQDLDLKSVSKLCQRAREALEEGNTDSAGKFYEQIRACDEGTGDNYTRGLAETGLAWCHVIKSAQGNGDIDLSNLNEAKYRASQALLAFEPHMSFAHAVAYFTLAFIHNEAGQLKDAQRALGQTDKALADAGDSAALAREIEQLREQIANGIEAAEGEPSTAEKGGEGKTERPEPTAEEFPPPPIIQSLLRLPVLGEIPAGPFMFTEDIIVGNIWVAREEAAGADYALLVKGDSMQGASINPSDYVLIREQPRAEKGDIVAALVIGIESEVTLKRFDYDDDFVYLYSETKEGRKVAHYMEKQEATEGLQILGKVVKILPA